MAVPHLQSGNHKAGVSIHVTDDIARQTAALKEEMLSRPVGLQKHVRRVVKEAVSLAGFWDVDPERVELACWAHDLFRHLSPEDQVRQARDVGIEPTIADLASPIVLHGPSAACVARDRFGVRDDDVLEAIASHTLGIPHMTLIAKVLLLADKFEPRKRKRRPALKDIRRLARRDLDLALLCWADWSWVEARAHNWETHPGHWFAREQWVQAHHYELAMPGRIGGDAFELDG
jgi:predicted HD superfamily hydrolase involved in NAD metabolism